MIKLKLMLLDKDENYIKRIVSGFNIRYNDKFEIYSFTKPETAMTNLRTNHIDVFLASKDFKIDETQIPRGCAFAYLVENTAIETVFNQRAIGKYQKADSFYKAIISLHSETAGHMVGYKVKDGDLAQIIAFAPSGGGSGSSSMAAACAIKLAREEKKVLYLNLEHFGDTSLYFKGEGQATLTDIIYSIKSKKTNMALWLEAAVRYDTRYKVNFYEACNIPLDIQEISEEDISQLLAGLQASASYDYIIIDIDSLLNEVNLSILNHSGTIIYVSDGSEVSNIKLNKIWNTLEIIEKQKELSLIAKTSIIYNKFSKSTSKTIGNLPIKELGGAPRYENANVETIINQLASMDLFDKIQMS